MSNESPIKKTPENIIKEIEDGLSELCDAACISIFAKHLVAKSDGMQKEFEEEYRKRQE